VGLAYLHNVLDQCIFTYLKNRGEVAKSLSKFKFLRAREAVTRRLGCTWRMAFRPASTYILFKTFTATIKSEALFLCHKVWRAETRAASLRSASDQCIYIAKTQYHRQDVAASIQVARLVLFFVAVCCKA
jgi:hypothetical protein